MRQFLPEIRATEVKYRSAIKFYLNLLTVFLIGTDSNGRNRSLVKVFEVGRSELSRFDCKYNILSEQREIERPFEFVSEAEIR